MSPAVLGEPYSAKSRIKSTNCPWRSPKIFTGARTCSTLFSSWKIASALSQRSEMLSALRMNERSEGGSHPRGFSRCCSTALCTPPIDRTRCMIGVLPDALAGEDSWALCCALGVPMLTRRASFSNWSMLSCRTKPPKWSPLSAAAATTTARLCRRTSVPGVDVCEPGRGGGRPPDLTPALTAGSSGVLGEPSPLPYAFMPAPMSICSGGSSPPRASCQARHAGDDALPTMPSVPASLVSAFASVPANKSSSSTPPRKPPYTNMHPLHTAIACLQRAVTDASPCLPPSSPSPPSPETAHVPALVHSVASSASLSTKRPPPSAPPTTCSRQSTNAAVCWYRADGAVPGAGAHSHRPSRWRASPYVSASG
mmetsp:Transcript_11191/g.46612  ORF Transcript_11191/g.46612 Transcript_11191/m.46612 type:complete len:368 (+) Transcript_11191:905-2008(+)